MRQPLRALHRFALLAALAALPVTSPGAQQERVPPHAIAGEVVHDESGAPIAEATVVLATATPGALPTAESTFVPVARSTRTGADGRYRFDGIPDGRYVLRVHRMGYRAATLEVELRGADSRVSVGLAVVPIRLSRVEVTAPRLDDQAGFASDADTVARTDALRERQRRYLGTDVRELTRGDVARSLALGDADLFRAVQRLPGVGAQSDWSAELQTRGARWDQTRVLFDGLPLFNPVHAGGLLSAVSTDAIGAAFLHPGVRPASVGEGSAAVLDLQSRPGHVEDDAEGSAELSMIAARAMVEGRLAGGRGAWMLAGRRSPWDLVASRGGIVYYFSELTGRLDWRLAGGSTIEVSALRSRDVQPGGQYDAAHYPFDTLAAYREEASRWGNMAGRVTLATPLRASRLGDVLARHTIGASGNDSRWGALERTWTLREPFESRVGFATLRGEYAPVTEGSLPARWNAGWALERQHSDASGRLRGRFVGDFVQSDTVARLDASTTQLALWGERRFHPMPALEIAPALRVETGSAVRGSGRLRAAPRLAARMAFADSATFLSVAAGRSWQYAQALPAYRRQQTDNEYSLPLWLVADDSLPALATDLATLGVERWLGVRWHASVNAYARRSRDLLLPDPMPGPFMEKALLVHGSERAHGLEASLRRLEGRWTMAAGYSWSRARSAAAGWEFASAADRRHVFDLTTSVQLGKGWRLGAAYSAATGAPYTRTTSGVYEQGEDGITRWTTPPQTSAPMGARLPAFGSLDLMVEWTGTIRGLHVGAWAQAYNVLMRRNAAGTQQPYACYSEMAAMCANDDRFQQGLLPVPVVGFRVNF